MAPGSVPCISRPRRRHKVERLLEGEYAGRQAATYSPIEWPAMASGTIPQRRQSSTSAASTEERGCANSVARSLSAAAASAGSAEQQRPQIIVQLTARWAQARSTDVAESTLSGVKAPRHARILGPLAGEHHGDTGAVARYPSAEESATIPQHLRGRLAFAHHDDAAAGQRRSPGLQREGGVG
jgi:hypothetical protein